VTQDRSPRPAEVLGQVIHFLSCRRVQTGIHAAESADLPPFHTVAHSFRQDYDAVRAALTTPWSMSQCEGHICRVKLLKRLGYGRAKLDLLRQRILHRMRIPIMRASRAHQSQEPVAA
jgi:transposase